MPVLREDIPPGEFTQRVNYFFFFGAFLPTAFLGAAAFLTAFFLAMIQSSKNTSVSFNQHHM